MFGVCKLKGTAFEKEDNQLNIKTINKSDETYKIISI